MTKQENIILFYFIAITKIIKKKQINYALIKKISNSVNDFGKFF